MKTWEQVRKTLVRIGGLEIGRGAPVRVESMFKNTLPEKQALFEEIKKLEQAGCELVRVAFPSKDHAPLLRELILRTGIAVMADVHFDFDLALEAIKCGSRSVRINPGNMGDRKGLSELVRAASSERVVLRIGANSGSLPELAMRRFKGDGGAALAEAVAGQAEVMGEMGFEDIILSAKSTSMKDTVRANLLLAERFPYPLHIGITEAGPGTWGIVKSSCGLAQLLSQGVGDTLRVSLTGPSEDEVYVGQAVLQHLGIRRFRADIVSCPTCGRKRVDVKRLVRMLEPYIGQLPDHWTVAVMGCEVNGPREASHADFGIAGTASGVAFFRFGRVIGTCRSAEAEETIARVLESLVAEENPHASVDKEVD